MHGLATLTPTPSSVSSPIFLPSPCRSLFLALPLCQFLLLLLPPHTRRPPHIITASFATFGPWIRVRARKHFALCSCGPHRIRLHPFCSASGLKQRHKKMFTQQSLLNPQEDDWCECRRCASMRRTKTISRRTTTSFLALKVKAKYGANDSQQLTLVLWCLTLQPSVRPQSLRSASNTLASCTRLSRQCPVQTTRSKEHDKENERPDPQHSRTHLLRHLLGHILVLVRGQCGIIGFITNGDVRMQVPVVGSAKRAIFSSWVVPELVFSCLHEEIGELETRVRVLETMVVHQRELHGQLAFVHQHLSQSHIGVGHVDAVDEGLWVFETRRQEVHVPRRRRELRPLHGKGLILGQEGDQRARLKHGHSVQMVEVQLHWIYIVISRVGGHMHTDGIHCRRPCGRLFCMFVAVWRWSA